jgi:hypothetical protein
LNAKTGIQAATGESNHVQEMRLRQQKQREGPGEERGKEGQEILLRLI